MIMDSNSSSLITALKAIREQLKLSKEKYSSENIFYVYLEIVSPKAMRKSWILELDNHAPIVSTLKKQDN